MEDFPVLALLAALCGFSEGRWRVPNLTRVRLLERGALACPKESVILSSLPIV